MENMYRELKCERIKEISCGEAINIIIQKRPIGRFITVILDNESIISGTFIAINNLVGEPDTYKTSCEGDAIKWLIEKAKEAETNEVIEAINNRITNFKKTGDDEELIF